LGLRQQFFARLDQKRRATLSCQMHRTCLWGEYFLKKLYKYIDATGTTVVG
jgi:hypothetical protein